MSTETCREKILSEESRDFIVSRNQEPEFEQRFSLEECSIQMGELYRTIYIDSSRADPVGLDRYPYHSIPKCYTLLDTQAMFEAGILQVQNYPSLELMGEGVMIGFVDTGIDYETSVFRNLDGSTRILRIWDQTIQSGRAPEGFFYGSEYDKEEIDAVLSGQALKTTVPTADTNGHGTFLASLASGGANEEQQFLGAAPESSIAVVKLKPAKQYLKDFYCIGTDAPCYQENDIMSAVSYLHRLAVQLELPLVLCLALGTNQGSHSAGSALCGLLEIFANSANRVVVIGGGNEASQRHHFLERAESLNDIKEIEIRVGEKETGFCAELWSEALNVFRVSIVSPSGETTDFFPIRSAGSQSYSFVFENTVLTVDYKVFVERLNATLIFIRFQRPVSGIWKIRAAPIQLADGVFHIWLPITEFLQSDTFFLRPNPDYTITEPGSTLSGITVGFYNGNDNSVAIPSGRGYTRSGRVKPDFVAPGVNVLGATNRQTFTRRTGSSIATGIGGGAAALILEWVAYRLRQRTIDSTQVRNLLILGTQKRSGETYPNREWGYGSLNVYQTFEAIRRIQ